MSKSSNELFMRGGRAVLGRESPKCQMQQKGQGGISIKVG